MPETEVPPPDEAEQDAPSWFHDNLASKEEKLWNNEEELRGVKTANERRWLTVYGWVLPVMMCCFSFFYISTLTVWAWHYLTPWLWLTTDQLSKIQSIIFSGSVGAFVAAMAQKHMIK
jgi:hypothetical protein